MSEAKTNEKRQNVTIYWDDPHIEAEMQLYPTDIAPLYRDAKVFVRDECKRNVDEWVERARAQKVTIDKTTGCASSRAAGKPTRTATRCPALT